MAITVSDFGKTKKGEAASLYTIENKNGMQVSLTNYGATLVSVLVPDADGNTADVVLGYEDVIGYENGGCYFGAVIGRNGNRIAGGRFTIDGKEYQLVQNENDNSLHSGPDGYDSRIWDVKLLDEENAVSFHYLSPDKEQGFPGNFDICVTYQLTEKNELILKYEGKSDQATVANMTNHSYFNLNGHDSQTILDHTMLLHADGYLPVADSGSIPTGEIAKTAGTPMDFTTAKKIGTDIDADFDQLKFTGGYDHNYVLNKDSRDLTLIAEVSGDKRKMEVYTDLPGVQFYAGNFIVEEKGKNGVVYGKRSGFCLETQYFPNAVNELSFQSPVIAAGEDYKTVTVYKFI